MTVDLTTACALTLQQPWAWAIAHHTMRVVNRTWAPPRHVSTLLIHAGKTHDDLGYTFLRTLGIGVYPTTLTTGAIVAVASLAGLCRHGVNPHTSCGVWAADGQAHWRLDNVITPDEPVPCRGRQQLWIPDADVLAQVAAQLGGAR